MVYKKELFMKKEWKDIYKIVRLIVLCEIIFAFIWRLKESEITCTHEEGICKMKAKVTMKK